MSVSRYRLSPAYKPTCRLEKNPAPERTQTRGLQCAAAPGQIERAAWPNNGGGAGSIRSAIAPGYAALWPLP